MTTEKKQILTVKNIRNVNTDNILHSIIRNQHTTRSILSKENNISLMTVKHVVDSLIERDILIEKESCGAEVGRKPKGLELAECYGNIVCVNLTSKDEIGFLIYDIYESLLAQDSFILENAESYLDGLYHVMSLIEQRLRGLPTKNVGIALFVPSAYDEVVDLVNYDLIPDFKELHIRTLFQERFGIKNVLVLHDVFAAARSEYDSLNPKPDSQFYFYCGYGVGGFFIHQGEAVSGSERMAGEVGKMLISTNGYDDTESTLEDMVSVTAIKKQMKERGIQMHFTELLALYQEKDTMAVELMKPVFQTVSKVLYNLLWVYNPSRIVIDSCKNDYSRMITMHFSEYMERMRNDAIPIHVEIQQARYDEYHMMHGCFHMTRNAWIEEIADSI